MNILVISSCTGRKKHKPSNQLMYDDFASSIHLQQRTEELAEYSLPAVEMYTGQHHLYLMEGLRLIREKYGTDVIDLHILSAGYGLLKENETIVPYNITFQKLKKNDLIERSNNLQIHEQLETLIDKYDLVFYLLGKEYVQALQLPLNIPNTVTQIFLAAPSWKYIFSKFLSDIHVICTGRDLANQLDGATGYNLKGFVFKRLCEVACRDGLHVFEQIRQNPQILVEIVLNQ